MKTFDAGTAPRFAALFCCLGVAACTAEVGAPSHAPDSNQGGAATTGGTSAGAPASGGYGTGGLGNAGSGFGGTGLGGSGVAGATGGTNAAGFGGSAGGTAGASGASGAGGSDVGGTGGSSAGAGGSSAGSAGTGGSSAGSAGTGGSSAGSGGSSAGSAGTGGSSAGSAGTGGTGACQTLTAPANMQETIDLTWEEMTGGFQGQTGARPVSAGVQNFDNAILDQVMESGGTLNFCIRYESNVTVTATQRDKVAAALQRGVDEWFAKIEGYDCFPYDHITTKVTGWATVSRSTFDWPDGGVPLFINQIGYENVAQCPDACSRFVRWHNGQSTQGYTYPGCSGGAANRFDMHLWLTEGFSGGAGGDWGQRVGRAYFMDSVDNAHQHIWLHEFGHGLGFPDYYNWEVWTDVPRPPSVMVAGAASLVTDWDGWMLRHTWSNLKDRWQ